MSELTIWRMLTLCLSVALLWALTRGPGTLTPDQWVEARAKDRARELSEIEAEGKFREGETASDWLLRRSRQRADREQLCRQKEGLAIAP